LLATRRQQPALRRRRFLHGSRLRAIGARDIIWLRADGGEMLHADWHDPQLHALGLILHGAAIAETDRRGEPVVGDTLALLLNADPDEVAFSLCGHVEHACTQWTTLVDTSAPPANRGYVWAAGDEVLVPGRSLILLAESR
ncbi:MAG: hypothetical protein KC442_17340, partial [Thermomicrobiales bacterium]|nr:hypothetical protein [Thermomicrobiales bacterium]